MSSEFPPFDPPFFARTVCRRARWLPIVRLIAALILTPAVLIYSWGRVLVFGMLVGRPEFRFMIMLVGGIAAVIGLTAGLSRQLRSSTLDRFVVGGVPTLWIGVSIFIISLYFGDLLPRPVVGLFFIMATLWVMWLAWMFYYPWSWRLQMGVLLILVPFAVAFPVIMRVDGLTGEARVNFAWRNAPLIDSGAELSTDSIPASLAAKPDLTQTTSDDFPQFLGPNRTGVVLENRLSPDWTLHPPREIWRKPVGAGWGSFATIGDYALTQEQRGAEECVVCYRLSDGSGMWVHRDKARFDSAMGGSGPRGTPTVVDGRVYTVGGTGILNCLDGATGKPLWSVDILADCSGKPIDHGVCGSPLVIDEWVIVAPTGNDKACLAAYDRETGSRVWLGGSHRASYGSPALADLAGSRQVLLVTADGIEGNDLHTGKTLWSYPWTNPDFHVNCSQPIIIDAAAGKVLFCTGYGTGSVLLQVAPVVDGNCSVSEVWNSPRKMKTKFTTAVQHKGFVYGLDDGILACLDPATGKQIWKAGHYQHGQILLAGELLIVQAESGDVVLVQPDPEKLIELGRFPALGGKTWNNPALAGRLLLVRNDQEAGCFELP